MNPHNNQNWAAMPLHLLQKVFTHCSVIDRISAERVCSHWKTAMSYADMTMIDLKEIFPKIKKHEISAYDGYKFFCVIQPSALTHCLDFLNKRKRITRLTCSPVDGACGKYSCLMHAKLPYLPGYHANEILDYLVDSDTQAFPARYWMLDMTVLDFLARECGDTLEALDLTHCAVDRPTLATLHSQGFPRLVEFSHGGVNEEVNWKLMSALSLNLSNFPALKSLSLTLTSVQCATALPAQLTTLRVLDLHGWLNLCFLEQCPNLEELYLISFRFGEEQFKNKGFRLENLKTLCFKETEFDDWPQYEALIEILRISPALHTFYWGMVDHSNPPSPQYTIDFDPLKMFKFKVLNGNLKVLGLSCTVIPVHRLDDLLICFPHLQALFLEFYSSQSLTALSEAIVNGALQLEELNLLSYFYSSLNSLSVLPNLKRIRFGYRFTSGVTAAALSKLPTTVNQVTIDDCSTSRVLRIPPDCSDRSSLFVNFLTQSTASEQNNSKRKRNSGSSDKPWTSQESDSDAARVKCWNGKQCYRSWPVHKYAFSHPGDEDWESSSECDSADAASKKPRKEIKFSYRK